MSTVRPRKPSGFVSSLLLVAACLLLYVSLPNVPSVIRAATVDGVAGTFTAGRLTCVSHPGHESCAWTGTFQSTDGTVLRQGVAMYGSGRGTLEKRERTAAVDVGNTGRVYGPEGSQEWIFTVLLAGAGGAILALLARRHLMPPPLPEHEGEPVPVSV